MKPSFSFSIFFIVLIYFLFVSSVIFAQSITDAQKQYLISQIQQQLTQVRQLLDQITNQQQQKSAWCYTFNNDLGFAQSGTNDIIQLHLALMFNLTAPSSSTDVSYAPDDINTYYKGTVQAVSSFQKKYGVEPESGYVGIKTRTKLNQLYGCNNQNSSGSNADTNNTNASAIVNPIPVTSITITSASPTDSISSNSTLQMTAVLSPSDATNQAVIWSATNATGVSISTSGILTTTNSVAAGTIIVTATAADGSKKTGTKKITILPTFYSGGGGPASGGGGGGTQSPTNGSCGLANGNSFSTAPTTNLCSDNSTPTVSGTGPWTWTCLGSNGGSPSPACTALKSIGSNCKLNSDCASNICNSYNNKCSAGVTDQDSCIQGTDCTSTWCNTSTNKCMETGSGSGLTCATYPVNECFSLNLKWGTCSDSATTLCNVSSDCSSGTCDPSSAPSNLNFSDANMFCSNLTTGGFAWKLPTVGELIQGLKNQFMTFPPTVTVFFDGNRYYWSSTPNVIYPGNTYSAFDVLRIRGYDVGNGSLLPGDSTPFVSCVYDGTSSNQTYISPSKLNLYQNGLASISDVLKAIAEEIQKLLGR